MTDRRGLAVAAASSMMGMAFSKTARAISTAALVMSLGAGCASTAKQAANEAVKTAATEGANAGIDQTLKTLQDPANRQRLQALAEVPDYRKIGQQLATGLSQGAIEGLSVKGRVLTATAAQSLPNQIGSAIADQIESRIRPAVANVASAAAASAIREVASDRSRRELAALSAEMARSVAEGTGAALRAEIAPALRAAIEKEVGPALASTSYEAGKNATLGARDAILGGGEESFASAIGALITKAIATIVGVLVLFGIVLIALALLFAKLIADRRSARAESERREAALAAVAGAIRDAENRPWSHELFDLLQKRVAHDAANPLGDVLLHAR